MDLVIHTPRGLYCPAADVYIDPVRNVPKAIITHAHSDHARRGHKQYISSNQSVHLIKHRLGKNIAIAGKEFGESFSINGVSFSFLPAGHIYGSAQVRIEYRGEIWVVSGDYKLDPDAVSSSFEPVKCHTFITECTFGLPIFKWPNPDSPIQEILSWWEDNADAGRPSILFAYSLGKAQRILASLHKKAHNQIFVHHSIHETTKIIENDKKVFPSYTTLTNGVRKECLAKSLVLSPRSIMRSGHIAQLFNASVANASGWMTLDRRRAGVDRAFILSDHCDWPGLLDAIKSTNAERILTMHGYTGAMAKYLRQVGYSAAAISELK